MQKTTKLVVALATIGLASAMSVGAAGAGDTLPDDEYLKQGNGICKAANKDLDAFFQEFFKDFEQGDELSADQQQEAADGAIPIFSKALDDIDDLAGARRAERLVGKAVRLYRGTLDDIDADPSIAFGDGSDNPFAKADKAAKKAGLKECLQGS